MCIRPPDILNIKGLEAEAQSRKKQTSVRSGRRQFSSEIQVRELRQPFVNVTLFFILGLVFTRSKCIVETKRRDSESFHAAKRQGETSCAARPEEINETTVHRTETVCFA